MICEVMTVRLCFWDNHLGSKAIKHEEKANVTDEHSVSEKLHLVKEVKPTHQGTNNKKPLMSFITVMPHYHNRKWSMPDYI